MKEYRVYWLGRKTARSGSVSGPSMEKLRIFTKCIAMREMQKGEFDVFAVERSSVEAEMR